MKPNTMVIQDRFGPGNFRREPIDRRCRATGATRQDMARSSRKDAASHLLSVTTHLRTAHAPPNADWHIAPKESYYRPSRYPSRRPAGVESPRKPGRESCVRARV